MDEKLRYLGWFLLAHLGNFADACLTLLTKFLLFAFAVDFMSRHKPQFLKWVAALYLTVSAWHLSFVLVT